jgi:glycogenin glucosyltransferase
VNKAFVTYLGTDSFLPGVLVLYASIGRFNEKYQVLILVSEAVSSGVIAILCQNSLNFIIVPVIQNPNQIEDDQRNYKYTYTKLRIFELFKYEKIVYLDADMLVCENIETLFDQPHFSAVSAGSLLRRNSTWKDLNSGLLVLEPKKQLFEKIINVVNDLSSSDSGDQGFLHSFFNSWPDHQSLHLDHKYNIPVGFLDEYCTESSFIFSYSRRKLKTNIAVIHFWGPLKPWNIDVHSLKRKTDDKTEQAIILWWDMYQRVIDQLRIYEE